MSQTEPPTQSSSVPTLAELISDRKAEKGWTYQQLADRADGAISRQRWQQLGTSVRIKEFPEPGTIQAIADALGVDVSIVVLAVARSIGLDVRRSDSSSLGALLPPSAANLSDAQRDAVLGIVRVMNDPAVGTGAFLRRAADHFVSELDTERTADKAEPLSAADQVSELDERRNENRRNRQAAEADIAWPAPDAVEIEYGPDGGSDQELLAARKGETAEHRRRRLDLEQGDPEGPEGGA